MNLKLNFNKNLRLYVLAGLLFSPLLYAEISTEKLITKGKKESPKSSALTSDKKLIPEDLNIFSESVDMKYGLLPELFCDKDFYYKTKAEKEHAKKLWSKNWEYLKQERLSRRTRDCNGFEGDYQVYDRGPLIKSLESLKLENTPNTKKLRDKLLAEIRKASKTKAKSCPTLGSYPDIDLLIDNSLKSRWDRLKTEVKAKAKSVGVDLTFQWDV